MDLDLDVPNSNISQAANGTFELIEKCVDIKRVLVELKGCWNK